MVLLLTLSLHSITQSTSQASDAKCKARERERHARIVKGRRFEESSEDDDFQTSPLRRKTATETKNNKGSFYGSEAYVESVVHVQWESCYNGVFISPPPLFVLQLSMQIHTSTSCWELLLKMC